MALRWIAVSLLIGNISYFAFGSFWYARDQSQYSTVKVLNGVEYGQTLELLSERSERVNTTTKKNGLSENTSNQTGSCLFLGPFGSSVDADLVQQQFFALGVASKERRVGGNEWTDYWLHIPPLLSRSAAVRTLRELQAINVSGYIINEGELTNGISLGFFSDESDMKPVYGRLIKYGYMPEIKNVGQKPDAWWLELNIEEVGVVGDQYWLELSARFNGIKKVEKLCKTIASDNNFL